MDKVTTLEAYYKRYLPKEVEKYPVVIRVTDEERKLILRLRGSNWVSKDSV